MTRRGFISVILLVVIVGAIVVYGLYTPPDTTEFTSPIDTTFASPIVYFPIVREDRIKRPGSDKIGVVGMAAESRDDFDELGGDVLYIARVWQCEEWADWGGTCIPYLDGANQVEKAIEGGYDLEPYPVVLAFNEPDGMWPVSPQQIAEDLWALTERWPNTKFYAPCIAENVSFLEEVGRASVETHGGWPPLAGLCYHCYGGYDTCKARGEEVTALAKEAGYPNPNVVLGEFGCPLLRINSFQTCADEMGRFTRWLEDDPSTLYYVYYTLRLDIYGTSVPGDFLGFLPLVQDYHISEDIIVVLTSWGKEWVKWPPP